jgi:hypothetical protein
MSRESRKKSRKARVREERVNPKPSTIIPWKAARNPDTRWQSMTARGGQRVSFTPVGEKIPVDVTDPTAPFTLALSIVGSRNGEGDVEA